VPITNPNTGVTIKRPLAPVATVAAPLAWTDLDISAFVGARRSLCLLAFGENSDISNNTIAVRSDGDTREYYDPVIMDGVAKGIAGQNYNFYTMLCVVTNALGVFEWRASVNNHTGITLIAYINEE